MNPLQLKNQTFLLTLNGEPIADLVFNEEGAPTLSPGFNPTQVRLFLAVMNLICGEYPMPESFTLEVHPYRVPRARPPLNIE